MVLFRKYLLTGLLILVPLVITLWILEILIGWMDRTLLLLPAQWHPKELFGFNIPGLGALLAIAVVLITGMLATNFIGRRLVGLWDELLGRIPIFRTIYSSVKQVSDTMLSPKGQAFRTAVLVEFPRKGAWSIGFSVGAPGDAVTRHTGSDMITVFVPTAPNPTSGYVIIVPKAEAPEIDMSVDEALKFIISLGVVAPSAKPGHKSALTSETPAQS